MFVCHFVYDTSIGGMSSIVKIVDTLEQAREYMLKTIMEDICYISQEDRKKIVHHLESNDKNLVEREMKFDIEESNYYSLDIY